MGSGSLQEAIVNLRDGCIRRRKTPRPHENTGTLAVRPPSGKLQCGWELEVPLPDSKSPGVFLERPLGKEGECERTRAGLLPQTLRFHGYVTAFEATQGPG